MEFHFFGTNNIKKSFKNIILMLKLKVLYDTLIIHKVDTFLQYIIEDIFT